MHGSDRSPCGNASIFLPLNWYPNLSSCNNVEGATNFAGSSVITHVEFDPSGPEVLVWGQRDLWMELMALQLNRRVGV